MRIFISINTRIQEGSGALHAFESTWKSPSFCPHLGLKLLLQFEKTVVHSAWEYGFLYKHASKISFRPQFDLMSINLIHNFGSLQPLEAFYREVFESSLTASDSSNRRHITLREASEQNCCTYIVLSYVFIAKIILHDIWSPYVLSLLLLFAQLIMPEKIQTSVYITGRLKSDAIIIVQWCDTIAYVALFVPPQFLRAILTLSAERYQILNWRDTAYERRAHVKNLPVVC